MQRARVKVNSQLLHSVVWLFMTVFVFMILNCDIEQSSSFCLKSRLELIVSIFYDALWRLEWLPSVLCVGILFEDHWEVLLTGFIRLLANGTPDPSVVQSIVTTVIWAPPPHQSSSKRMHHELAHRPIYWEHFLNQDSVYQMTIACGRST